VFFWGFWLSRLHQIGEFKFIANATGIFDYFRWIRKFDGDAWYMENSRGFLKAKL
jgi:hypothetical protein